MFCTSLLSPDIFCVSCSSFLLIKQCELLISLIINWFLSLCTGFLRRRNKKKKREDEDSQKEIGSEGEEMTRKSQTPTPDVDEEGYSRQPSSSTHDGSDPWADFNQPNKKFDSSSDESGVCKSWIKSFFVTFYMHEKVTFNHTFLVFVYICILK